MGSPLTPFPLSSTGGVRTTKETLKGKGKSWVEIGLQTGDMESPRLVDGLIYSTPPCSCAFGFSLLFKVLEIFTPEVDTSEP